MIHLIVQIFIGCMLLHVCIWCGVVSIQRHCEFVILSIIINWLSLVTLYIFYCCTRLAPFSHSFAVARRSSLWAPRLMSWDIELTPWSLTAKFGDRFSCYLVLSVMFFFVVIVLDGVNQWSEHDILILFISFYLGIEGTKGRERQKMFRLFGKLSKSEVRVSVEVRRSFG